MFFSSSVHDLISAFALNLCLWSLIYSKIKYISHLIKFSTQFTINMIRFVCLLHAIQGIPTKSTALFLSFYGYLCSSHRTKNLRPRIEVPKEKRESESRPEPLSKFHKSYQENRTKLESGPRKQGRPCSSSRHSVLTLELFTTFFSPKNYIKTNSEFSRIAN